MTRPAPTSTLFPYTTLFRSAGNLEPIAQKIETELGGHAVRHVAAISSDALFVGHFHLQNTDGQSQSIINRPDRKSTRLNSSHANNSYTVFCLKQKKIKQK